MRQPLRVVLALALAASAAVASGCADPDARSSEGEPPGVAAPPPEGAQPKSAQTEGADPESVLPEEAAPIETTPVLLQQGCSAFYSGHRVDMAYAQERLPEGLRPWPHTAGGALLMLKAWTCPKSTIDAEPVPGDAALVYYIAVVPDAAYASADVTFSWYPLEIITSSPELAAVFTAWGFTVAAPGDVAISWDDGFDPWLVTISAAGRAEVDAAVTIPSFARAEAPFTVRYFAGDGAQVLSAVDIVVHPGMRGGSGATLLSLTGTHAPAPVPVAGTSSHQGWREGELAYTWTPVAFDA